MPGVVTHNKIFKESITHLRNRKKKSYLLRSIESLLSNDEYYSCGLFGSFGPNIFDYIPRFMNKQNYGSTISHFLHDEGCKTYIPTLINEIYQYTDKNNDWSATQRAYLYGFISHIIADEFFHPFLFYFSGFPDIFNKQQYIFFREQNLLFQYNIDNYYLYYAEDANELQFTLDEMFPPKRNKKFNPAIKSLILKTMDDLFPEFFNKIIIKKGKEEDPYNSCYSHIDLLPKTISFAYWIKNRKNRTVSKLINNLRRKKFFYSDFMVQYPPKRRFFEDALNFHKGRWEYPAGKKGIQYDSINDLFSKSVERTVELWEKIESSLYEENYKDLTQEFTTNNFTGEKEKGYFEMTKKEPIRLII